MKKEHRLQKRLILFHKHFSPAAMTAGDFSFLSQKDMKKCEKVFEKRLYFLEFSGKIYKIKGRNEQRVPKLWKKEVFR